MNRRHLFAAAAAVALVVALWTAPAGAQFVSNYFGRTFTSTAPSGSNGFACRVDGCRLDLGPGTVDHLYATSNEVRSAGNIRSSGAVFGASLTTDQYVRWSTGMAVPTCTGGLEGYTYRLFGTGGTGTTLRTRLCICTSDGAASPVYAWVNLISGTVGNTTTCSL